MTKNSNQDDDAGALEPIQNLSSSIVLPVDSSDFGAFLAGLLKVPKTLRYLSQRPFVLKHDDIEDFDRLIDQRISDQQSFSKVSTEVSAHYEDGTSVHCSSLREFSTHSNLGKALCTRVSISFVYLIDFPGLDVPSKQEVTLDFSTSYGPSSFKRRDFDQVYLERADLFGANVVEFSIRHTHTTFGFDLANILKNRMQQLRQKDSCPKFVDGQFFKAAWVFLTIVSGAGIASLLSDLLNGFLFDGLVDFPQAAQDGILSNSIVFTFGITAACILASVMLGFRFHNMLTASMPSFILLNKEHSAEHARVLEKQKNRLSKAVVGAVFMVCSGVVSSLLATGIWARLIE